MNKHATRLIFLLIFLLTAATLLCACASRTDPLASTEFSSVTLDQKNNVHAQLTMNRKDVELHAGKTAYVYELLPGESLQSIASKEPLDAAKIAAEMRFSFPLTEGEHTRLYSSFVVCFQDGTPIVPTRRVIQNTDLLAAQVPDFPWHKNQKGLCVTDANAAAALGTAHAMTEVRISSLLAAGDLTFDFNGVSYAVSASYLDIVDRQIQSSYLAGMKISLRLIADVPCNAPTFTALADFLFERYSTTERGIVTAVFVDPALLTSEQIELYTTVCYTALRARVSSGQIFVVAPRATVENTKLFFADVGARIAANADFEWGAAVIPSEGERVPWSDADASTVCANTLGALFADLKKQDNPPDRFAVCDLCFDAADEEMQAVSLAYGYAAAVKAGASMVFYQHQRDDACGLTDSTGQARTALGMFGNLDATLTPAQVYLCKAAPAAVWETVSTLPTNRRTVNGTGNHGMGSGNCTTWFDFTASETYGFSATGGITIPTIQQSDAWNAPVLYTWMHAGKAETGVRKILNTASELSGASMLSVQALAQYQSTRACSFVLRLQGVDKSGQVLIYEAQASVKAGSWQLATFSVAPFVAEADPDAPCVMTFLTVPSSPTDENFVLWVKAFYLYEPQATMPTFLPIALVAGGCGASFLLFYLLYQRSHRAHARRED